MREVISSGGTIDPITPAASSAGASSPTVHGNVGIGDGSVHGQGSKGASISYVGSQPPMTSLSNSAGAGGGGRGSSGFGTSKLSCRPWERGDLLRRLATFKPSHWFGKPKVISSLACARRGWKNVDVDKVSCESCCSYLTFSLLPTWSPDEVQSAGEVFFKQLDSGHKVACPWRGNSCPESLVQFPPTPQSALIGGYKDRCDGLLQFRSLPKVAASVVEQIWLSRGPQIDRLLSQSQNFMAGDADFRQENIPESENSRDGAICLYSRAQRLISLCGWEPRWLLNIQDYEEHSAQSARNGYSLGPTYGQVHLSHDPGASKKAISASARKDTGKSKVLVKESRGDLRSPLLDCSLCGATVRIYDFLTIPRPIRYASNNIDIPDISKKMGLIRGASAASGISGWVATDDAKEHTEDRDEVATTTEGNLTPNVDVDLNLTMSGGLTFNRFGRAGMGDNINDADMGRDLMIGQPQGSEVGDRAASYESRGPSSRKRSLDIVGSSVNRPNIRTQQADSVEGTVIDRDGDEVTDCRQDSAGPSKRARDSDFVDTYCSSDAGPSHSMGLENFTEGKGGASFPQGSDQYVGVYSARDSARASSVIAMDTIGHTSDDDSMASVDMDDIHLPSSSTYGNLDLNETSEVNYSNQAQQSIGFQPVADLVPEEMGVFNAETVTAQARDGFSFGMSRGSVGMCASHEAEIHGADASVHRADSVVGDVEPRTEDAENQGQTDESAPDPGVMDEIVPDEIIREDPQGDSQEILSRSVGRADSSSKIDGCNKAESVESGEKNSQKLENGARPSLSCNANVYSNYGTTKKVVKNAGKSSFTNNHVYPESEYAVVTGLGESNCEEPVEFDTIGHHNQFCPWVNGNVAAAGSSSNDPDTSADVRALCGWKLTLDALDALRSLGHDGLQTLESESAASQYKDDHRNPGKKILRRHSVSRSHGQY